MKNCKGIIMDIDNTIYNYDYCHQNSINLIFNEIKNKYSIPYDIVCKQYEQSKININKYLKNTASSHNKLLQLQNLLECLNIFKIDYLNYLSNLYYDLFFQNMHVEDGLINFLNINSNKKILFLTDMTIDIQIKKLINLNIFSSNISIVTSEEFGIEKPSILLYNYAINKLKLLPNEICTIGDNYEKDIEPSLDLNLTAYWYNKYNSNKIKIINNNKCFIINDYNQLNNYFNE